MLDVLTPDQRDLIEEVVQREVARARRDNNPNAVEASTAYEHILREYLIQRHDPDFNTRGFHRDVVVALDKKISAQVVEKWKRKFEARMEAYKKANLKRLTDPAFYGQVTPGRIRDATLQVFMLKVIDFLENPDQLATMKANDAINLYKAIEGLALKTRELDLKEASNKREGVMTVLSLLQSGMLSGEIGIDAFRSLLPGLPTPPKPIDVTPSD